MNISTIHFQQGFVEFKIYISLKRYFMQCDDDYGFVEFKIYISLKRRHRLYFYLLRFVEFKIYISLKPQIEIFDSNFAFYKLIFNCI